MSLKEVEESKKVPNPFSENPKTVSAFVRCFNEEEFIQASVRSIIDSVDEVVISDGGSTDNSISLINELKKEYPDKIVLHPYPHKIVKMGIDHFYALFENKNGPDMPHIYNNWLLERCSKSYALRWDADMIATQEFHTSMEYWKSNTRTPLLTIHGVNVFPDRQHSILKDPTKKLQISTVNDIPFSIAFYLDRYTSPEKRAFPKGVYTYIPTYWWCEDIYSPISHNFREFTVSLPCYAHMKLCKDHKKYTNFGKDLEDIFDGYTKGSVLQSNINEALRKHGLKE